MGEKRREKILDAFNSNRCNPDYFFYLIVGRGSIGAHNCMAITRHGHWALLYTSKRESPRIFVINLFVFVCVCGCVCPSYLRGFGRLGSKGDGPIVFLHFLFI
jgi:hypothetical protein